MTKPIVVPVNTNVTANLDGLRFVGKNLKIDLTSINKNNSESLYVIEKLIGDEPAKHFYMTFLFVVPDGIELMNLLSPTVVHIIENHVVMITKPLIEWVKVIFEYSNTEQEEWIVQCLNQIQLYFESIDLAHYFIPAVKTQFDGGFYLR